MNDIYNLILSTIYERCLKLLEPESTEFKRHFAEVDDKDILGDEERAVVSGLPRILQYVQRAVLISMRSEGSRRSLLSISPTAPNRWRYRRAVV